MDLKDFTVQVIKHLELQPGDTLVFSTPDRVSASERERFGAHVKNLFPGIKAILMDGGMNCDGVLRLNDGEALGVTMSERKEVPKQPAAYVTTGFNEHQKIENLGDGRRRVTVFKYGKESHSYIEDSNKPQPWWKLW